MYMEISSSGQFRLLGDGKAEEIAVASILRISRGGKELSKEEKEALKKMKEKVGDTTLGVLNEGVGSA